MVKKPAGTLPIRKHKFTATPSTGQAITKFFDKKEEQARLQQQLSKPRPAGPPPTFSGQAVGPRAQDATVGPATAKATNAAPATKSAAQPGVVHVTSAALPHVQPQQSTHDATDTLTARLTSAHHQDSTVPLQQQPVTARADAPVNVKPASEGVALASTSVDGFQQPRQRSRTQPSLEFMMSQDDDGCRIKWQASPQHHHDTCTPSQAGPGSDALLNHDVTAMKQRLANAVQRSSVGSAESSKHSQSSESRDTLLDDLLALPPPQHSRLQKVTSLERMGPKVLSPSNRSNSTAGSGTPRSATKTPGRAGGSSDGPRKRVTFGMDCESGTPGSVQTGSVFKKKTRRLQHINENSGTGSKRSGGRKRKAHIIDLLDQIEVMVQSRNVRERLAGDEVQDLPSQPSQEPLLSQQAEMLHDTQNPQEAVDCNTAVAEPEAALDCNKAVHCTRALAEPEEADTADESLPEVQCERQTDEEAAMHQLAPAGPQEPDPADVQGSGQDQRAPPTAARTDESLSHGSSPTDPQPGSPMPCRLLGDEAERDLHHTSQQAAPAPTCNKQQQGVTDDPPAGVTASTCRVSTDSGVLAEDALDVLDSVTAGQLAQVEAAAQLTAVAQHAQHTLRQQQAQQGLTISSKATGLIAPVVRPSAAQDAVLQQGIAAVQQHTQKQSTHGHEEPRPALTAQCATTQHSVFDFDDSFPDSMDFNDELAQLMDSAQAPRPAGLPHPALAGPGPHSASSLVAVSRSASAASRQHCPSHSVSNQTPESCSDGPSRGVKPPLASLQQSKACSQEAAVMAAVQGDVVVSGNGHTRPDTSRRSEGVLAPEPAGPVEPAPHAVLPHLPGDRVHVNYQVKAVIQEEHAKVLHLEGTYTGERVVAHLKDGWCNTPVEPGHCVNLIAAKAMDSDGVLHAVCTFQEGMVILHPDLLLSGTRVTGSFKCERQAVLEERFGGSSSDKAVEGTLLHELFQVALTKRITSKARLEEVARCVIAAATDKLLEVGLDEHQAMARLQKGIPSMTNWVQRFLRAQPAQNATVDVVAGDGPGGGNKRPMCVRQVVDIEENVWAPKYGLKGMIDASLSAGFQPLGEAPRHQGWMQSANQPQQKPHGANSTMVPLEFKTGKPHMSHNAQVSLYLLLMQERYGQVIESGLLWYLGSLSPHQVKRVPAELQALITHRNTLAAHLMPGAPLPEVIRDEWACNKCFQKAACAISHKAVEQGNEESSGLGEFYTQQTGHVTEASAEFFQHWLRLVELEEAPLHSKRAEIWVTPGQDREKAGRCICDLVIDATAASPSSELPAKATPGQVVKHKLLYTFTRANQSLSEDGSSTDALNEKGFTDGDMVILSIEGEQACVQRPTVSAISAQSVTLAVEKPLRGSMLSPEVRWRIDKDEVSSIFTRMRCNLLDLMDPALEHVQQARRLIADLEVPRQPSAQPTPMQVSSLNEDQQAAVNRVLTTPDYTLILGMPGTGKTSTIVQAIKGLLGQGKSVLLTSYTNSAVDNVLLKLLREAIHFLRLGRRESVHPLLQGWTVGGERYPDTSVKALRQLSETAQVVACTALGVNHCLLKGRIFDMCIMDEAGQMTLPVALGPILHSKAFTLVGDHYQLPPLVTSKAAEAGGLGVSLFKRLCEAHPQSVASLTAQYRMSADIMLLANTIVYKGQLRCGADHVAEAVLDLQVAPSQVSQPEWLVQVLAPHKRALFLDTDGMPAPEARAGDALSNPTEAAVLTDIVKALALGQVPLGDIGIISPYRAQVLLLQRLCKDMAWSDLEVLTVDKCQGRDKDVVLLSLVCSNSEHNAGNLLKDWRRLNVAITRAKKKLILIGSQQTLRAIPHFAQLLDLMAHKRWLLTLPGK